MKKIIPILIMSIIASVVFCSCGKTEESKTDEAAVVDSQEEAAVQDAEGASKDSTSDDVSSGSKEIPQMFPQDILPVIEGGEITSTNEYFKDRKGGTVTFTVNQAPEDAYGFYKSILEKFDKFKEAESEGEHYLFAETEGIEMVVTITPLAETSTEVMLNAKSEKK